MRSEAVKRAQAKYEAKLRASGKKISKEFILKCHLKNDADIIEELKKQDNKNGYIKRLIREDIKRREQE